MKSIQIRKVYFAVAMFILALFGGCSQNVPTNMTAEETVRYYFAQFDDKNKKGMEAVTEKGMQNLNYELNKLNSVKIISCEEEKDTSKIKFDDSWYHNPYQVSMIKVKFEIDYKNGYGAGFSNGTYSWKYYLVKSNAESDWLIVMWGSD